MKTNTQNKSGLTRKPLFKKLAPIALVPLVGFLPASAQVDAASVFTVAETQVSSISASAGPAIITIATAVLGIYALFVAWNLGKRMLTKAG